MEGFTSESPKQEKIYSRSRVKTIILREIPSSTIQNDQLPIVMRFLAEKQWMNILNLYHHEVQLGSPILWIQYFFLNTPINCLKFAQKLQKPQGKLDTDGSSSHRSSLPGTATIPTYNEFSTNKPHYESQTKNTKIWNYTIQHNPSNFWRFPYYPLQTCWSLPAFNRRGSDAALHSLLNRGNCSQPSELMVLVRACAHVMYMQLLLKRNVE